MLSDWGLLLSWAHSGRAESRFGEAGVTNLLHLLRDALAKATGGPLLGAAGAAEARRAGQRDRQQAQVGARGCSQCVAAAGWQQCCNASEAGLRCLAPLREGLNTFRPEHGSNAAPEPCCCAGQRPPGRHAGTDEGPAAAAAQVAHRPGAGTCA